MENGNGKTRAIVWVAERIGIPTALLIIMLYAFWVTSQVAWRDVVLPVRDETLQTLKSLRQNTTDNTDKLGQHAAILDRIEKTGAERTELLREIRLEQERTTKAILKAGEMP